MAGQVLTDLPVVLICRSRASRLCLHARQISSQAVGLFGLGLPHEATNLRIEAASVRICVAYLRTIERLCRALYRHCCRVRLSGKNFTAEAIEYSSNISAVNGDESCFFYELTVSAA